jgi:hypothetical protein
MTHAVLSLPVLGRVQGWLITETLSEWVKSEERALTRPLPGCSCPARAFKPLPPRCRLPLPLRSRGRQRRKDPAPAPPRAQSPQGKGEDNDALTRPTYIRSIFLQIPLRLPQSIDRRFNARGSQAPLTAAMPRV